LQYHEVNREKGLFYVLQNNGLVERVVTDEQIEHAVENPPEDTRAYLRGELIRRNSIQSADWDKITLQGQAKDISLKEPLAGTKEQVGYLFENGDKTPEQIMTELDSKGFVEARTFFQKIFKPLFRQSVL